MDEDLLVLLEPGVERVPLEPHGPGQAARATRRRRRADSRPDDLADPQTVQLGAARG